MYLLQTPKTQFGNFISKSTPFGIFIFNNFKATWLEALENSLLFDITFYFIFAGGIPAQKKISDQITLPPASVFGKHLSRTYFNLSI